MSPSPSDSNQTNNIPPRPPGPASRPRPPRESNNWQPGSIHRASSGDSYQIEKKLGEGGFSFTYLATNLNQNNRREVIKRLKPGLKQQDNYANIQQAFRNEGIALARCSSPYIVKVFTPVTFDASDHSSGDEALLLEYIQGQSLQTIIDNLNRRQQKLSLPTIRRYLEQLVEAVSIIHTVSLDSKSKSVLLHLDINPNNLLVRRETDEVVLIDFGLASFCDPQQHSQHQRWLTDSFAPIEQYAETPRFGRYTDIYAVAATAYFLLTQKFPLAAPHRASGEPLDMSAIPPEFKTAIEQGLALDVSRRPQTIKAWRQLWQQRFRWPPITFSPISFPSLLLLNHKQRLLGLCLVPLIGLSVWGLSHFSKNWPQLPLNVFDLRHINSNNWQTYANPDHELRIKYPPEWSVKALPSSLFEDARITFQDSTTAKLFLTIRSLQEMPQLKDYWKNTVSLENQSYQEFRRLVPLTPQGLPPSFPLVRRLMEAGKPSKEYSEHPAYRLDYEYRDPETQLLTHGAELVTVYNGNGIHLILQAPPENFQDMEPYFEAMAKSLEFVVPEPTAAR